MTLRARLVAAAVVAAILLVSIPLVTINRQGSILTDQIDDQLRTTAQTLTSSPLAVLDLTVLAERQADRTPAGDLFVAAVDDDGALLSLSTPVSAPDFALDLTDERLADRLLEPGSAAEPEPFTTDLVGDGRARAVVVAVGERSVVIAHSLDRIDEAQRDLGAASIATLLAVAATLALAFWWVDRLGLRPIDRLTTAAEEVASGRSDRRVDHPPISTEAGRLGASFNTMLDARQAAEERQRRFVADASHELRTPLTTLRGYTALYESGGLSGPADVDDAMRRIRAEAERMAVLVEDLLTLASLDEDRPLDLTSLDLSGLLQDVASDAAAVQPDREVDAAGVQAGLTIRADQHLLLQALTAVVSNVLRHTEPSAGLRLSAAPARGEPTIVVEIADRGPGIEPAQLDRLFDRFYRVDSGRTAAAGGRGLGLSIARTVIEAHGGTIEATSTVGAGTTITIHLLPLAE
ncbi:MAG: HAMP domain-containing sensor histidine kinase [Actinomycetota bacterium]